MRKLFYYTACALCMGLGFASCADDEDDTVIVDPAPKVVMDIEGGIDVLRDFAQLDTLKLKAQVLVPGTYQFQWIVDGKNVSTDSTYAFTSTKAGEHTIALKYTNEKGESRGVQDAITVNGRFADGTFVLVENFKYGTNGTLTHIDKKGMVVDSAYYRINNRMLGNICEDLFIANDKMYVIAQNYPTDSKVGMLTVANAQTLEHDTIWSSKELNWPTHLAVANHVIYIRDNKGVWALDDNLQNLSFIEGTEGATKLRMTTIGDKAFAANGKNVMVLQDKKVVKTLEFSDKVTSVVKSADGNLMVSTGTTDNKIITVNPSTCEIVKSYTVDGSLGKGWGVAPAISVFKNYAYYTNTTTTINRYDFTTGQSTTMVDVKNLIPDATMYYNSLGVNPTTGDVVMATIKGYGPDALVDNIMVMNFDNDTKTMRTYKGKIQGFPAGVFFPASFK